MIINPFREHITTLEGTPLIVEQQVQLFVGTRVLYGDPRRQWAIQSFFLPSRRRGIQGIRAKLQDQKGFVTFCNQRDLEVLLGLGTPGTPCYWLGRSYVAPGQEDWYGFLADDTDLWDDLYEKELYMRGASPRLLPGTSLTRYAHLEEGVDVEETWILIRDGDHVGPDPYYETRHTRWVRAERTRVIWDMI